MNYAKTLASLTLTIALMVGVGSPALAVSATDGAIDDMTSYMYETVSKPEVGSIGGEWAVIGLARSGADIPDEYYDTYYKAVEDYVAACDGKLHDKKYTEYSRVALAVTAIGKDPTDVAGYDLLAPLGDYEKTIWQGLNGPVWALIALDSNDYDVPNNSDATTQATRALYVQRILDCQLNDGGFSLFGGTSEGEKNSKADPDITGMVLQALSGYQDTADVQQAIDKALAVMSKMQLPTGGFPSMGKANMESTAQMLVGLTSLGISLDDARFVKNGNTVLDGLMDYYVPAEGFTHTMTGDGQNQMASEQGLYALVALNRAQTGEPKLYDMTDVQQRDDATDGTTGDGLQGKHSAVKPVPVTHPERTFDDVDENKTAIEALATRNIISGKTAGKFAPDDNMTRAEFATVVVKSLGLTPKAGDVFTDVPQDAWFAPFVGTAYEFGLISGSTATTFSPNGIITRQEAAVMVARAGALCGLDVARSDSEIRDMLSQFGDYTKSAQWARQSLAFCYDAGILNQSDLYIEPLEAMTRGEIAQMLFALLTCAELV